MADSAPWQAALVDHDADESRVYFGPFKSPEKKYIGAGLAVPQQMEPSLLRRSPRLSSPIPNPPSGPVNEDAADVPFEDEDGELSRSRSGTPDNDGWQQDEPSSVLGSRITHAHANPSPPPVRDLDSAPPTPDRYPAHFIPFITPNSPSPLSRGGSTSSPRPPPSPQNTTQPDLISFDSFYTAGQLPSTHPIASTSFVPPDTHIPSVDELLSSWSPSALDTPAASVSPPSSEVDGDNFEGKARPSGKSTSEVADEQAAADASMVPEAHGSATSAPSPLDITMSLEAPAPDDEPTRTPLRRSSRPRRSGTPHAHLVPLPSSDDEESPMRTHLTSSGALTKKRRKGKEREVSGANDSQGGQAESSGNASGGILLPENDWEMKRRKERGERKQAMVQGTPQALQRQLGSLSPGSANVLTQLLTPSRPSPVREQDEPQQLSFSFSVFPVTNPVLGTPARRTSTLRSSPVRHGKPRSPNRIQFQAPSMNDPNRTPARRIPVEEAVARGQISPQKGVQLLANNSDAGPLARTPVFRIPSQDTPARRVNAAPGPDVQGRLQGPRFGSPTRGRSREHSGSVEPRPPWDGAATAGPSDLGASASKSRSSPSRSISAPIKKGKLPFPLTPSEPDRPAPIPEDKVLSPHVDPPENPAVPAPPPVLGVIKVSRSILKQSTSRIPRIGTKPYARPAAAPASDKGSKAPAAAARKPVETARLPPSRTIRMVSGSGSDDMKPMEAGPSSLKRKRVPSPQNKPRPVVLLRQVAHTKFTPKPAAPAPAQAAVSPVKKPLMAKFRMVDFHARPNGAGDTASKLPDLETPVEPAREELHPPTSPSLSSPVLPPPDLPSDPNPPSSPLPELGLVRRTTRLRKPVFPSSVGSAQPLPTRRKVSRQDPPSSGAFAGMTAVALKALTSSNTSKNQKYLAARLETEVVRKEGARPESPAVKIRTIAQREQEDGSTQRKARAARRARRSDDGLSETDDAGYSSMLDAYSDDAESSPLRRHTRGPGDEEDYETPGRPAKRARSGSVSGDEGQAEKKRVKWHRGLSTAVFLDEVEPRTKARPKENLVKKGCLAPTAKALRLDPLGNHPNAESPLKDLIEENIVVKKFVYDNDDEPVLPVIVVKNTRSKAKKKS